LAQRSSGVAARAGSEPIEHPAREGVELGARRLGAAVERRAPLRVGRAQGGRALAEDVGPVRLIRVRVRVRARARVRARVRVRVRARVRVRVRVREMCACSWSTLSTTAATIDTSRSASFWLAPPWLSTPRAFMA
jgi:hypothetical protein